MSRRLRKDFSRVLCDTSPIFSTLFCLVSNIVNMQNVALAVLKMVATKVLNDVTSIFIHYFFLIAIQLLDKFSELSCHYSAYSANTLNNA